MIYISNIGVFGGSFDPVHNGHIAMARLAVERLRLDKMLVIPAKVAPYKKLKKTVSGKDRLNMLSIAFEGMDKIEISDIELKSKEKLSYTVNTLKHLDKIYNKGKPNEDRTRFFLICGADTFMGLQNWKNPEKIFALADIVAFLRDDVGEKQLSEQSKRLSSLGARVHIILAPLLTESSTAVRNAIINKDNTVCKMLPSGVYNYILSNHLYEDKTMDSLEQLAEKYKKYIDLIKTKMGEKRFIHSINMANQAYHLAELYGADKEKAYLAGILHDITKELDFDKQLEIIKNSGIKLTPLQMSAPKLWHSISGACYLRDVLGIKDEDIFNAVRYHTTARANMSLLEKVIFIADFTGIERDYDGAQEMKIAAEESLEKAMKIGITFSITDLASRGMTIASETLDAYNELILSENKG